MLLSESLTNIQISPPKVQLLKWVGSKQKFVHQMSEYFPETYNCYHEPFLGSGSVLAALSPFNAYASDIFEPLIDIWKTLKTNPQLLIAWYAERVNRLDKEDKKSVYNSIRESFNRNPNGADFLFLSRTCWGGIIRFRKADGHMSTPVGWHNPISIESFKIRVDEWHQRTKNTIFECVDYKESFKKTLPGDFIYCDPPYRNSQPILYGSQNFKIEELFDCIKKAKLNGVYVAMSLDGNNKSGKEQLNFDIPKGLFEREININDRISMLLRFKKNGQKLTMERDSEKLYLTY